MSSSISASIEFLGASRHKPGHVLVRIHGRVLQLSAVAYMILQGHVEGLPTTAIVQRLQEARLLSRPPREEEVAQIVERLQGFLTSTQLHHSALWLRRPLLRAWQVAPFAKTLAPLIPPPSWVFALLFLLLGMNLALLSVIPMQGTPPSATWWALPLATFFLMLTHELGHAAAAQRFGAPPQDIGCGLFWAFPALYTDVTRIWTLPPEERIVVNLSGALAQLALTALILLLAWGLKAGATPQFLNILASASVASCLVNLLPFSRLDGYWVMVDWLDQPHLHQRCLQQVFWDLRTGFAPMRNTEGRHPRAFRLYAWAAALFQLGMISIAMQMIWRGAIWITEGADLSLLMKEACNAPLRSAFIALILFHLAKAPLHSFRQTFHKVKS